MKDSAMEIVKKIMMCPQCHKLTSPFRFDGLIKVLGQNQLGGQKERSILL